MKTFTDKEIEQVYKMDEAIKDTYNTLNTLNEGLIKMEQRTVIPVEGDKVMLYMPCVDNKEKFSAVKIISIYPENAADGYPATQAVTVLTELEHGENVAVLSASYLTRLRTGAMTGIATDLLAKKDAKELGIIGTGGMAFEQALGVLEVRDIKTIRLFNRTLSKCDDFKARLEAHGVKAEIEICENVNDVTRDSDIINTATNSTEAVFEDEHVKDGAHINGLGSYMPEMREIHTNSIKRARHVIFDDVDGVIEEAGEFIHAVKTGDFKWEKAIGLNDALDQEFERDEKDITIFKSVGASYYDMSAAIGAYKKLV